MAPGPSRQVLKEKVQTLVFGVCDMFNALVPASAAGSALVALLRGRAAPTMVHDCGPMGPGVAGLGVVLAVA